MKLALISDTHYGVRNDNVAFLNNSKKFLDNVFFPTIEKEGITTLVHLGDLVDRRKYININTANRLRKDFLEQLRDRGIECHFIAGNHDTYYKNTNELNALRELVFPYPFRIYDSAPEVVTMDGLDVLFIPWICESNKQQSLSTIGSTNAQVAMGHLELSGFEMYRGSLVSHGEDRNIFKNFDMVFSGHYHHISGDGTIYYLGNHGEFTWSDYDDPKGFHIFDTNTRQLKFIQNPYKIFKKIYYNDSNKEFLNDQIDYSQFRDTIIKIIVQEKNNLFWFDKFIENIEEENPIEIKVVEDHLNLDLEDDQDLIDEAESTIDIFKKYISGIDASTVNTKKLEDKMVELYNEAIAIE